MWTSQREELSTDSLTTVMVLAQKLKLHNPVLTAAPGLHEEMCLQITRRNSKTTNNNNSTDDTIDSGRWEKSDMSNSASSTLSSASGANEQDPFLRKHLNQKSSECGNQKLIGSLPSTMQQRKSDQNGDGSSPGQKLHSPRASSTPQKTRVPSRILGIQRRPLLSRKAVDVDTENDSDTETSNDTEVNCTSDDELRSFGIEATSNSDYDDAFESVSDFSAREDNIKSSGKLNPKPTLTNSCHQKQENAKTKISASPMVRLRRDVRGTKVKGKQPAIPSMTPPNSVSTSKPFRYPHSGTQDIESKFCRFSPQRQKTSNSNGDNNNKNPKSHPRNLIKTQISDRHDDGLGASVDDNDDGDVTSGDARHKHDVLESRKKRNDRRKSRNSVSKKQDDTNGSDLSYTSSSSSLSGSPFAPVDTSSPLVQHPNNNPHRVNSDHKQRLENGGCAVNDTTDFGQKLNLLQSELVQLRHHDEKLARQFLQIYRDIQILKVQRACLDHQDLLDDAIDEVEERDRLLDLCDTPPLKHSDSKLRHCGLTKMNICSRRFSCS